MASAPTNSDPIGPGRVNGNDHGAILVIASGVMLGASLIAMALRLFQRWPWNRLLKLEDAFLIAAVVRISWN